MNTNDAAFGFGQQVTGGGTALATPVANARALTNKLGALGDSDGPTVLELSEGNYDLGFEAAQRFTIRARNLTIRAKAGARVVLQKIGLILDLERADNILIQGLSFRSDGFEESAAEDAITFELGKATVPANATTRLRVTHCSFDGYFDIALEIRSQAGKARLLATIDHCLFFDSSPGQPRKPLTKREDFRPFANRGAINIASLSNGRPGNSFVTVANNAFVDVWRRSPRVAFPGNFGHVYNNLLYRWGFGNNENDKDNGTQEWNGMAAGNGGAALIQANRFIPWENKLDRQIDLDPMPDAEVDIGLPALDLFKPDLTNRFDSPDGAPAGGPPKEGFVDLDMASIYARAGLKGLQPTVTPKNLVSWVTLFNEAGPRPDLLDEQRRQILLALLAV